MAEYARVVRRIPVGDPIDDIFREWSTTNSDSVHGGPWTRPGAAAATLAGAKDTGRRRRRALAAAGWRWSAPGFNTPGAVVADVGLKLSCAGEAETFVERPRRVALLTWPAVEMSKGLPAPPAPVREQSRGAAIGDPCAKAA